MHGLETHSDGLLFWGYIAQVHDRENLYFHYLFKVKIELIESTFRAVKTPAED